MTAVFIVNFEQVNAGCKLVFSRVVVATLFDICDEAHHIDPVQLQTRYFCKKLHRLCLTKECINR